MNKIFFKIKPEFYRLHNYHRDDKRKTGNAKGMGAEYVIYKNRYDKKIFFGPKK